MPSRHSGDMGSSFTVWRSKSFRIRFRMKLNVFFEILKVFLNRSSVYVVQTISHQPLLLSRRRHDRTWTISVAKFCLLESNKIPAKDKRRAIRRLLNAMSICALSENILLRSFPREIALIRAILSFTATIFESWIMARRYDIGPRPFSFSLHEIKIRFDTRCAVWIRCRANVAPKSNQTQLGSAHEWSGVWTGPNSTFKAWLHDSHFVPDKHTRISLEQCVISWPIIEVWHSFREQGKSQNNGLITDTLFFSPPLVSALCSSHSSRSSRASCEMLCSPCLAHKRLVMQWLCSLMFPLLQSMSLEKLLCSFKFYYSFKLRTSYHIYF